MGLLLGFGLLQRDDLCIGQFFASSALSRLLMVSRSWRNQTQRTPAGETATPRFLNSLAMRTWPKAGLLDRECNDGISGHHDSGDSYGSRSIVIPASPDLAGGDARYDVAGRNIVHDDGTSAYDRSAANRHSRPNKCACPDPALRFYGYW
jgi:hypothetical protein